MGKELRIEPLPIVSRPIGSLLRIHLRSVENANGRKRMNGIAERAAGLLIRRIIAFREDMLCRAECVGMAERVSQWERTLSAVFARWPMIAPLSRGTGVRRTV